LAVDKILPPHYPIKIKSGIDRYGFSSILARRLNMGYVPRSFADWMHGWAWWTEPKAEHLVGRDLHRKTSIVVNNNMEKEALLVAGFKNVRTGGLPFAYVSKQNDYRSENALLAYPPHSAEAENLSTDQKDYFDYLESLKKNFTEIYVSIYYLDLNKPMHSAASVRGLKVIQGANPSDANGLIRVRSILDSFKYVTSNVMGSHMLYALYAGCNFSFSGPFYTYDESMFLANGNPHKHTKQYIDEMISFASEKYVKGKFFKYFTSDPFFGIQDSEFAAEYIGEKYMLNTQEIKDALGWSVAGQITGYTKGAARRLIRLLH